MKDYVWSPFRMGWTENGLQTGVGRERPSGTFSDVLACNHPPVFDRERDRKLEQSLPKKGRSAGDQK
jgi:hypothetical protein